MKNGEASSEIGIVLYPGAQLAAVHGLTDLFLLANRFALEASRSPGVALRVSHWNCVGDDVSLSYSSEPATRPTPEILVLPPTLDDLPDAGTCQAIARWLVSQHAQGVGLATVCSGVFLVAPTGLLDGRTVSTHRTCAKALAESFPDVGVDCETRIIEHPDILTAGGFMSWVDVALILIERLLGQSVRAQTARFILAGHIEDASGNENGLRTRQSHGDDAVKRAQDLVHMHDGQGVSLNAMIAAARLERRTFLRRFVTATSMTPIAYCRAVRDARAREILEAGNAPLKKIAEDLGYGDVSSFARAFRRTSGMSPAAYRKRYGGAVTQRDGPSDGSAISPLTTASDDYRSASGR